MTPSEKPERSAAQPKQDAEQSSVITQTVEDRAENASAPRSSAEPEGTAVAEADDQTASSAVSDKLEESGALPPWQRTSASTPPDEEASSESSADSSGSSDGQDETASASGNEKTQQIPRPVEPMDESPTLTSVGSDAESARSDESAQSDTAGTAFTGGSAAGGSATRGGQSTDGGNATRRSSRGPRRASLHVKRVDPWSVLKLSLALSVALFFVWMIAVAVLYGVLDGMGVWDQLNGTFTELTRPDDAASEPLISAGRVFGVASIIGAINIVLMTALATVAAFIYNVAADLAGGVEVTLSERE